MEQTRYKDYKYNIHNTFKNSFIRDFLNPLLFACNLEPGTTSHYLLWCHLLQAERRTLLNDE